MVSQRFRTLGCPPAVGPAKQSKILGPFRRGVSRFRRFAFRVLGTPFEIGDVKELETSQAVNKCCRDTWRSIAKGQGVAHISFTSSEFSSGFS